MAADEAQFRRRPKNLVVHYRFVSIAQYQARAHQLAQLSLAHGTWSPLNNCALVRRDGATTSSERSKSFGTQLCLAFTSFIFPVFYGLQGRTRREQRAQQVLPDATRCRGQRAQRGTDC